MQNSFLRQKRRSTTEVYPNFSEDPHLRSSILIVSHPKTGFNKNAIASPMNNPMAHVCMRKRHIFRKKIGSPLRFRVKEPRNSENLLAEMCYTSITVERVKNQGTNRSGERGGGAPATCVRDPGFEILLGKGAGEFLVGRG